MLRAVLTCSWKWSTGCLFLTAFLSDILLPTLQVVQYQNDCIVLMEQPLSRFSKGGLFTYGREYRRVHDVPPLQIEHLMNGYQNNTSSVTFNFRPPKTSAVRVLRVTPGMMLDVLIFDWKGSNMFHYSCWWRIVFHIGPVWDFVDQCACMHKCCHAEWCSTWYVKH